MAPLKPYPGAVLAKTRFSALDDPDFPALLPIGSSEVIIAGCEAHVCVLQTALDLVDSGFRVAVAADAASSRDPADAAAGIARARQHGADIVIMGEREIARSMLERAAAQARAAS